MTFIYHYLIALRKKKEIIFKHNLLIRIDQKDTLMVYINKKLELE